jgi:lysophospholipase L1-like esterase
MTLAAIVETTVSRRRKTWIFGAVTVALVVGAGTASLLLADVYLHRRVQNLAGVNVWGYRGPSVGRKRSGDVRIVALGGSTTFGYGLPWNEAWPFYLEAQLNEGPANARYQVVNLGAPGQGAYGFSFDLADYAYLGYDVAIFYEGYNDLGRPMAFDPTPRVVNHYLWRRQSPVFRLTGYFPVLPLVLREKAMALRAGGDLNAAYRGEVHFKPGLAAEATASVLASAATITDAIGKRLGGLSTGAALSHDPIDDTSWTTYTASVLAAVEQARSRRVGVAVVTQPYVSDAHVVQQRALAAALKARFGGDAGVRYVNLGDAVDLRDRAVAYDGLHLVARANRTIAERLTATVRELAVIVTHPR